jgi:hypothetical protein
LPGLFVWGRIGSINLRVDIGIDVSETDGLTKGMNVLLFNGLSVMKYERKTIRSIAWLSGKS